MVPMIGLGPMELVIILVIVLLLFGGSRLAGLGKNTGRAIREFKEETKDLGGRKDTTDDDHHEASTPPASDRARSADDTVHEAEIIDPETKKDR